jgi:hypothetical protein
MKALALECFPLNLGMWPRLLGALSSAMGSVIGSGLGSGLGGLGGVFPSSLGSTGGGLGGSTTIEDPSTSKPDMVLKAEINQTIAPVLTDLGELYSPVKSGFLPHSGNKSDNPAEKNPRVFLYEDGNWSLKGRYEKAIKINNEVVWSNESGEYTLVLHLVEFFIVTQIGH